MANFPWDVLGIAATRDRKAIRGAYSARLKALDVDADVEGYATLRSARDEALFLATHDEATAADVAPQFAPVVTAEVAPTEASETLVRTQADIPPPSTAPDDLTAILFPENEVSDKPLSVEEYERAEQLLQTIIADARTARIDTQTGIERWLAHHLADAWPRSAPLVPDAAAAFSWQQDTGRIDEEPAIAFLNGRLDIIRRTQQMEEPGHKYHDAWVELKKPGPRSRFAFGGPKRAKVAALMLLIREDYPELETFLDAERVESWIDPKTGAVPKWLVGFLIVAFIKGAVLIGGGIDDQSNDPVPTVYDASWSEADQQAVIDDVLGHGISFTSLSIYSRAGAANLKALAIGSTPTAERELLARQMLRNAMRKASLRAARAADFDQLLMIKTLKRDMLKLARDQAGSEACNVVRTSGTLPDDLDLPDSFKASESEIFRLLADANLYFAAPKPLPASAPIPEEIVEAVMATMGIGFAEFETVAAADQPTATRCDYEIALLDAVLRRPGSVSDDLLRMM